MGERVPGVSASGRGVPLYSTERMSNRGATTDDVARGGTKRISPAHSGGKRAGPISHWPIYLRVDRLSAQWSKPPA